MNCNLFINLIFWLFPCLIISCVSKKKENNHLNIICIFSDELSLDYLVSYGGHYPTQNLYKLANEGIRFTNAYSAASMCTPSRFGLLTGQYPGRCTHPNFIRDFPSNEPYSIAWNTHIDSTVQTIARQLSNKGYITGMVGKWHVSSFPESIQLPDLHKDDDPTDPIVQKKLAMYQEIIINQVKKDAGFDYAASVLWGNFDGFPIKKLRYHNFPWITKGAVDFLELSAKSDKPFFLYVASTAVHGPHHGEMFDHDLRYTPEGLVDDVLQYQPPEELIKNRIQGMSSPDSHRYSGITCLDHHVGIILNKLEELNLVKNTIIVFLSDHNIEPGKTTCYDKGFRIPMIIKWPGVIERGSVTNALTQSVDLMPTFLNVAGVNISEDLNLDGKNLMPLLENRTDKVRENVYLESGYSRGISNGKFKYIAFRPPQDVIRQMQNGEIDYAVNILNIPYEACSQIAMEKYPGYFDQDQLYDLESDPYEQNNLADDPAYKEVLTNMQEELKIYLETFNNPFRLEEISFMKTYHYKELIRKSRALGTDWIDWLERDHGTIIWPPEK